MPKTKEQALERCYSEQARCRDHILAGKPDSSGAWMGLEDWIAEEIEIALENGTIQEYYQASLDERRSGDHGRRP